MKTTRSSPRSASTRTFPMPLWLQGTVEFFVAAFISLLAVFALMFAVDVANGFEGEQSMVSTARISANTWLLMHGVSLHLNIPVNGVFDAIAGTVSLTPLGLMLIPLALTFRAGRRLAQASYEGQFWQPVVAGIASYGFLTGVASFLSHSPQVSTSLWQSILMPVAIACAGTAAGGYYESRSLARMIGVNAATWVTRFSQYSRWAGSYAWAVVRSAVVGMLAFTAAGALLAAIAVFYNWNDIVATYQSLHAGVVGDTAITLLQFGFVLNFLVYAMAWSTGAGFALGEGTSVNFVSTDVGVMPALPLLSALPQPIEPFSYFVLVAPILSGALAGWWFFREGENHFDEWLSLKIRFRWISWPLATLFLALLIGLLSGLAALVAGALSHGSLGLGRLTDIGANPLLFAVHTAVLIACGVIIGSIIAPLVEPDNSTDLERFADARASKEKTKKRKGFFKLPTRGKSQKKAELETPVIDGEVVPDASTSTDDPYLRLFADENTVDPQRPAPEDTSQDVSSQNPKKPVTVAEANITNTDDSVVTPTKIPAESNTSETVEPATEQQAKKRPIILRPKAKKKRRSQTETIPAED